MKDILLDTECPKVEDIISNFKELAVLEETDTICCVNINDGCKCELSFLKGITPKLNLKR